MCIYLPVHVSFVLQQAAVSIKCNDLPTPGGCARRISVASASFRPSWSHTGWVWRSLSNMLSLLDRLSYPESRGQLFTSFFSGETLSMFFTRLWRNKVICLIISNPSVQQTQINKTNSTAGSLDSYFFYLELMLLVHVLLPVWFLSFIYPPV